MIFSQIEDDTRVTRALPIALTPRGRGVMSIHVVRRSILLELSAICHRFSVFTRCCFYIDCDYDADYDYQIIVFLSYHRRDHCQVTCAPKEGGYYRTPPHCCHSRPNLFLVTRAGRVLIACPSRPGAEGVAAAARVLCHTTSESSAALPLCRLIRWHRVEFEQAASR